MNNVKAFLNNIDDLLFEADQLQTAQRNILIKSTPKCQTPVQQANLDIQISSLSPQIEKIKQQYSIKSAQLIDQINQQPQQQQTQVESSPYIAVQSVDVKKREIIKPQQIIKKMKDISTSPIPTNQNIELQIREKLQEQYESAYHKSLELFQKEIEDYKNEIVKQQTQIETISKQNKSYQKKENKAKSLINELLETNQQLEGENNTLKQQNQHLMKVIQDQNQKAQDFEQCFQDHQVAVDEYKNIISQQIQKELEYQQIIQKLQEQNNVQKFNVSQQTEFISVINMSIQVPPDDDVNLIVAYSNQYTQTDYPQELIVQNNIVEQEKTFQLTAIQTDDYTVSTAIGQVQTDEIGYKFQGTQTEDIEESEKVKMHHKKLQVDTIDYYNIKSDVIEENTQLQNKLQQQQQEYEKIMQHEKDKLRYYQQEVKDQKELISQLQDDNQNNSNENQMLQEKLLQATDISEQMSKIIQKQKEEVELLKIENHKLNDKLQQFKNLIGE